MERRTQSVQAKYRWAQVSSPRLPGQASVSLTRHDYKASLATNLYLPVTKARYRRNCPRYQQTGAKRQELFHLRRVTATQSRTAIHTGFTTSATLRAIAHVLPAASPFLPPCEWQSAGRAGFDGQLAFFHSGSPSSNCLSNHSPRCQSACCLGSGMRSRFL